MDSGINHLSEFTLHVVLATFPQNQEKEFDISVKEEFYKKYRESSKKYLTKENKEYWHFEDDDETQVLYNPLSYFILGNYDVAYITLIDSFKFAQRLFEAKESEEHTNKIKLFGPHTFQSFTGIAHHDAHSLKQFFHSHLKKHGKSRKYFLGICNLKLNNGFLIGNGLAYLKAVLLAIDEKLKEEEGIEYIKLQSFSWFEISLMIFADDPQLIAKIIQTLRRLTMENLLASNPTLLKDSLYKSLYSDKGTDFFKHANVFADTHTYFGIHSEVFEKNSEYGKKLLSEGFALKTEVEWQVKPGHMHILAKILNKDKILKKYPLARHEKHFLAGRSDYSLKGDLTELNDVIKLIQLIFNREIKLYEHVRKIKTNIYFDGLEEIKHDPKKTINLHQKLTRLAENMKDVAEVNRQLKALKLSRQIRSKVMKIFSNYNNGVQDIVLFPYLLDFKIFIHRLKVAIQEAYDTFKKRISEPHKYGATLQVDRLEDILMKMIDIFQEGFNIRMLNPYQFEDINDFDLDFNSSIQQLLSVYSTVAFEIGNLIYVKEPYSYGPVIQLNLKDTVSNDSSINYYVHHLTSPEFVFATLTKEIINALPKDDHSLKILIERYNKAISPLFKADAVLADLNNRKLINFNYFLNDAFRYIWTYKMDFPLFHYWSWTYNFQNASLYSEIGLLDENHFEKELFRILFIAKFFKQDCSNLVECPLPELATYWERHYEKIDIAVINYINYLHSTKIIIQEDKVKPKAVPRPIAFHLLSYVEKRLNDIMEKGEEGGFEEGAIIPGDFEGAEMQGNIEFKYSESIVVDPNYGYVPRLARRCTILKSPLPPTGVKKDSILYLEWYMWRYLNEIYELNQKKISLIRRNWEDGEPMISFVKESVTSRLYSVDQTGGLFFENMNQQNLYFKHSTRTLLDLWNFSLIRKKEFITTYFPKKGR